MQQNGFEEDIRNRNQENRAVGRSKASTKLPLDLVAGLKSMLELGRICGVFRRNMLVE